MTLSNSNMYVAWLRCVRDTQNCTVFSQKSRIPPPNIPVYPPEGPIFLRKSPIYPQKSPISLPHPNTRTYYIELPPRPSYLIHKNCSPMAKEPYISVKEPYISVKEPYISVKGTYIPQQNPISPTHPNTPTYYIELPPRPSYASSTRIVHPWQKSPIFL